MNLAGIGEITTLSNINPDSQIPKFFNQPVGRLDINSVWSLKKIWKQFPVLNSLKKNWEKFLLLIYFIEKHFHCWFYWKKFSQTPSPKTDRHVVSKHQTPNHTFHEPTGWSWNRLLLKNETVFSRKTFWDRWNLGPRWLFL
jgi:hypothetical protein